MAKDFDFKQFMLAKGERVGLWVAVGLMAILVAFGAYSTFTSASPTGVADTIDQKRKMVVNRIEVGANTTSPDLPTKVSKLIDNPLIPTEKYPLNTANFSPQSSIEDTKRQNPVVLTVAESSQQVVRGSVTCYDVVQEGDKYKIGVVLPVDKDEKSKPVDNAAGMKTRQQLFYERLQKLYPQAHLPAVRFDLQHMKRSEIMARIMNNLEAAPKFELKHLLPEQAEKAIEQNGKYAKAMYPIRGVVVAASFPYREQLEAFRRALRKPSIPELLKEKDFIPQFLGIDVQRRVVKAGTTLKLDEGWEDVDTALDNEKNKFHWREYRWLLSRAFAPQPEEPELAKTVIFNRMMVMPRPELGRGEYPKLKLKTIDTTLQNWTKYLQKTGKAAPTVNNSVLNRRLTGDLDILADKEKEEASTGTPTTGEASKAQPFVPDYCLLRFLDVTVRPGQTYEYRVRVRLSNPNYGKPKDVAFPFLAEIRELEGPWSVMPAVTVPNEFYFYAENDPPRTSRAKDRAYVQIHRWLDFVPLDPASTDTMVPIADWAISDVPVMRGEYIGKVMDNTQVVMYYPTQDHFDFAIGAKSLRPRPPVQPGFRPPPFVPPPKVMSVDFTTNPRALLVDFEGGESHLSVKDGKNVRTIRDDASVEILVLTEDGKLKVRNSAIDVNDPDRKKRHDEWAEEVKKVKAKPTELRTSHPKDKGKDDPFKDKPKE